MSRMAASMGAALALVCAASIQAHHSGLMYQTTPIWVQGTVVSFERTNPHSLITLEASNSGGEIRRWVIEGPPQNAFERLGIVADVVRVGDVVEFCAFPYKSVAELSQLWPGADFSARRALHPPDGSAPQYVAGHVLVLSDGQRQLFEPHGILSECMRTSDDQRQSWLAFIAANSQVREAWCAQRRYAHVQSTPALQRFIVEIDGLLDSPC